MAKKGDWMGNGKKSKKRAQVAGKGKLPSAGNPAPASLPERLASGFAKDKRHLRAFLALSVVLMCAFILFSLANPAPNYSIANKGKGAEIKVNMEIASTPFARMRGLMFREKIIPILFIFDEDGFHGIHSNFVISEFDAVYISSDNRVTEIFRRIPPATQLVSPQKQSRYLLELPTGVFDSLSIEAGDEITWKKLGKP